MNAYLKIAKSFVNHKSYLVAIITICISSFLLISSFVLFFDYTNTHTEQQNSELYGTYNMYIENISEQEMHDLTENYNLLNYSKYRRENMHNNHRVVIFIYPDNKFMSMYSLTLTAGTMPKNSKEILCEPWLLYQNGISADNMIGATIMLNNTEYTVSGLLVKNTIIENDSQPAYVVGYNNQKPNAILMEIKDFNGKIYEEICQRFAEKTSIFIGKNIDREMIDENKDFLSSGVIIFLIITVITSSVISVWNCVNVFIKKNTVNISIYHLIGIRRWNISAAILLVIILCIFAANTVGFALFALLSSNVVAILNSIDFGTIIPFEYSVTFTNYLLLSFLLTILEAISAFAVVFRVQKTDSYSASINYGLIETTKPSKKNIRFVFWNIAGNNFRLSRKRNIFAAVSIILSAVMVISLCFMLNNINTENIDYGENDYIVTFPDEALYDDENTSRIVYDKLRQDFITETRNIFFTQIRCRKDSLTDDYKNILSTNTEYSALFNNKLNTYIEIPVSIISYEQLSLHDYSLKNSEAVIFNQLLNSDINVFRDLKIGDTAEFRTYCRETLELQIKSIEEKVNYNFYTNEMMLVILVNDNTFNLISNSQLANKVYVKNNMSERELVKLIDDNNLIKITNLHDERQNINLIKNNIDMLMLLMAFLFLIGMVTIGINISITMYIKNMFFAKEYAVLNAIGIKTSNILRIVFYETLLILVSVIPATAILSFVSTWIIKQCMHSYNMVYIYPLSAFGLCCIGIIVVLFLCMLPLIINMLKKTAYANLTQSSQ